MELYHYTSTTHNTCKYYSMPVSSFFKAQISVFCFQYLCGVQINDNDIDNIFI